MQFHHRVIFMGVLVLAVIGCGKQALTSQSAQIDVQPLAVDFGVTLLGASSTQTIEIKNLGQKVLELEPAQVEGADFEGPAAQATVSPGGRLLVNVSFAPVQAGTREGVVHILSNAENQPDVAISLTGVGVSSSGTGGGAGGGGATGGGSGGGGGSPIGGGGGTDAGTGCDATAGQACTKSWRETSPGCDTNYGCASFWAIYYESTNGCDPFSASSSVEYPRGGCTYVGYSASDPFQGVADGNCHHATMYSIANTYTKVVPGSGCTYQALKTGPGIYDCDGVCQ